MGRAGKKRVVPCKPFDWSAAEHNLAFTVRLQLYWPQWDRTCEDCAKYSYIEGDGPDAGTIRRQKGDPTALELRQNPKATPCISCKKIPRTAPSKHRTFAVEATELTLRMIEFYAECKAVGVFPDDAIVRWYARIIDRIERGYERNSVSTRLESIASLLAMVKATR